MRNEDARVIMPTTFLRSYFEPLTRLLVRARHTELCYVALAMYVYRSFIAIRFRPPSSLF